MKKKILNVLCLFIALNVYCGEGMWLPFLLSKLNEKDMKAKGLKISAEDIYSTNKSSLKDAIVSLGGFCTAEVISKKGLILTNHHCGYDAIQNHSTLENNLLKDGFWAKSNAEEKTNPGLTATFIVRMEDVSSKILEGVTSEMSEKDRQSQIDKNIAMVKKDFVLEPFQDVVIKSFYDGNQYIVILTETFKDVRLVGAPPSSIGKFGSDTDNWVWPRHTGDFSLFRIYANSANKPAEYSVDNVPYVPKNALKISLDGVENGDFTMVYGFPGRTQEYLPAAALEQTANVLNPIKIQIRENAMWAMNLFMRVNEEVEIQYAAKYAGLANYTKKWTGESLGIRMTNAVEKKQQYESEFVKKVKSNPTWNNEYSAVLGRLNDLYKTIQPYYIARDQFQQIFSNSALLNNTLVLERLVKSGEKDDEKSWNDRLAKYKDGLNDYFREYNADLEKTVFFNVIPMFSFKENKLMNPTFALNMLQEQNGNYEKLANAIFEKSDLVTKERLLSLLTGTKSEVIQKIRGDVAMLWANDISREYYTKVDPKLREYQEQMNKQQRIYMRAQMDVFKEKKFFPDANSTLRLTYGNVAPYEARDAISYKHITYLDGILEKYKPGDYEFDVPKKLIDLYKSKDYGVYKDKTGKLPVCFIGSNHTTGGNSGSPALDGYGNLIGLNFDRVWEGTMSDMNYDPNICRNIMVDARYILFVIDKFANATNLMSEIEVSHPKKK